LQFLNNKREEDFKMGHWGWLIAIYLFLGGLGAGAYLTSFAAEKGPAAMKFHPLDP